MNTDEAVKVIMIPQALLKIAYIIFLLAFSH